MASFASLRHWRKPRWEDEAERLSREPGNLLHHALLFVSRGVLMKRSLIPSASRACARVQYFKLLIVPGIYVLLAGGRWLYFLYLSTL